MLEIPNTILSLSPTWKSDGGIMSALTDLGGMPWSDTWTAEELDTVYYTWQSGCKTPSVFLSRLMGDDETITQDVLNIAATAIKARYLKRWQKLWETLEFDYNPINNYDMVETSDLHDTHGGTDTRTTAQASASQGDVYAFNNASATPATRTDGASESSDTMRHGETIAHTGTFTRSGNIGIMTSQSLITEERDIWMWDIMTVIFKDIDRVLCNAVY